MDVDLGQMNSLSFARQNASNPKNDALERHATSSKTINILWGCKKISWKMLTKEVAENLNQDV